MIATMKNNFATSLWLVSSAFLAASLVVFLFRGYQERRKAIQLKKQGFAIPPYHPIFGHLLVLAKTMSKLPKDAYASYLADRLRRAYPDMGPIFYLDAWPLITLTLVVASPDTMAQITTEHVLPKFPAIKDFMYPLANGQDIVSMDGEEWKYWRDMFNPGFSASHLLSLVPEIVKETRTFLNLLDDHAHKPDIFRMKNLTDNLTMDIIGKVVLDSHLDCQRRSNPMFNALRRQMRWMVFGGEGNPFQPYHPLRPLFHWYNTRQMDSYISPEVDAHFKAYKANSNTSAARSKTIVDLALKAYLKQKGDSDNPEKVDDRFKTMAMNQWKVFLFSGHDTTSSAACYVIYLLSIHPRVLSHVRAELDQVFGAGSSQTAADQISQNPILLNKLPYITAIIKEAMRLFPAASTTRRGEPSFTITDSRNGLRYPADPNMLIWLVSYVCQRDPSFWPRPDEFLPERWLAKEGEELHPTRGAWRPFEYGPRACIGQELSMIELKIVVCLIARSFEIQVVYDEVDAGADKKGKGRKIKTVGRERIKVPRGSRAVICLVG